MKLLILSLALSLAGANAFAVQKWVKVSAKTCSYLMAMDDEGTLYKCRVNVNPNFKGTSSTFSDSVVFNQDGDCGTVLSINGNAQQYDIEVRASCKNNKPAPRIGYERANLFIESYLGSYLNNPDVSHPNSYRVDIQ